MAGLSLCVLLVVATVTVVALRGDGRYVAPRPDVAAGTASAGAASATLTELVRAVSAGDSEAAAALAPPGDGSAATLLAALADNGAQLSVEELDLRYVDEVSGVADGRWTAAVDATWAFGGFDPDPARTEILVGFRAVTEVDGTTAVYVDSVGGGDRRTPLWLTGPVSVGRSETALVLVAGGPGRLDAYLRAAEAAVPVVQEVLPRWRDGLVVEVPADTAQLGAALDVDPAAYDQIAAVTAAPDGSLAPQSPAHVFLNPGVYDELDRLESQVVMTHEATHVATAAPASLSPTWLLEGIADYVALRDVDLPQSVTAAQVVRQVRRQGVPRTLPSQADFDTGTTHLGAVYEAAWVACLVLVERRDQQALVRLYERASGDGALQPALQQGFGWSDRELLVAWQEELAELAG